MIRRSLVNLSCLVFVVAAGFLNWQPAAAENGFPQENAWHRITPSVVWCGDPDSTVTIEVHIVGRKDVAEVFVAHGYPEERFTLYDDGTHGDAKAGDRVFTLSDVQLQCNPGWLEERGFTTWWGALRVKLTNGTETGHDYGMSAGLVHSRFKEVFTVKDFGGGLTATAYAFFIQDSGHEIFDDYPVAPLYCGRSNFVAFRRLYSVMPDAFDFVLLMPGMQMLRPDGFGENTPYDVLVSNDVQHLGLRIMDNTGMFGSAGRLKSMIYHSFGDIDIFDHEVGHTWGAGLGASLGLAKVGPIGQGHWHRRSDVQGQMGQYYFGAEGQIGHFAYNGDGTWRLIPNTSNEPYSPLELYMMGLIPPEEVPPIHILRSPDLTDPERITAESVRTITIEEIMQAEGGPRKPASDQSPKEFDLAFVVTHDLPYNDAAYAFFSLVADKLRSEEPPLEHDSATPFYWATGGRATLNVRLPIDLPEPLGLPYGLQPTPEPTPTATATATASATNTPLPEPTQAATATPEDVRPPTEAPSEPTAEPGFCPSAWAGAAIVPGFVWWRMRRRRRGGRQE